MVGVTGDDDSFHGGLHQADFSQCLQSVHFGHTNIMNDQVKGLLIGQLDGFFGGGGSLDLIVSILETIKQALEHILVIL